MSRKSVFLAQIVVLTSTQLEDASCSFPKSYDVVEQDLLRNG